MTATTCWRCSDCTGQDHHWIEAGDLYSSRYECKHCRAQCFVVDDEETGDTVPSDVVITVTPAMASARDQVITLLEHLAGDLPTVADACGSLWARHHQIPLHHEPIVPADIAEHGKYLGPRMRNRRMAERGDVLLAFWDGVSGGTSDMVCRMVARGKPVRVVPYRPRPRTKCAERETRS